jgi:hypothetical protein
MVKQPPCISVALDLAVARLFRQLGGFACASIRSTVFLSAFADHRHHQAVGRIGGETDVVSSFFITSVVAVERGIEGGDTSSAALHAGLDQEGQHGQLGTVGLFVRPG